MKRIVTWKEDNTDTSPLELYCFIRHNNQSNPEARITYFGDNKDYKPARMNYQTQQFDFGDWADAFFIKNTKPCMLNRDGTIAYYLNPNDYRFKEDGSLSAITTTYNNNLNAMVEVPLVWIYRYTDTSTDLQYTYIANKQVNDKFKAYAHTCANGTIIPYIYIGIYQGSFYSYLGNNKTTLRSLSNVAIPNVSKTVASLRQSAYANNIDNRHIWFMESWTDKCLINDLLELICKSTNIQQCIGYGYGNADSPMINGKGDTYGMFKGWTNSTGKPIKTLYLENWYNNAYEILDGITFNFNTKKYSIKATYDMSDGSTGVGFLDNYAGYKQLDFPSNYYVDSSFSYYKQTIYRTYSNEYGVFPVNTTSSGNNVYECDYVVYYNNTNTNISSVFTSGHFSSAWSYAGIRTAYFFGYTMGLSYHTTRIVCKPYIDNITNQ